MELKSVNIAVDIRITRGGYYTGGSGTLGQAKVELTRDYADLDALHLAAGQIIRDAENRLGLVVIATVALRDAEEAAGTNAK